MDVKGVLCVFLVLIFRINCRIDGLSEEEFKQKLNLIGSSNPVIGYIVSQLEERFEQFVEMDEEKREAANELMREKRAKWTARINKLTSDIVVLEELIHDEEQMDELLQLLPGEITDNMNKDVEVIRQRVNEMNKFMDTSFDDVDHFLSDVRQSAVSRNVQVAGVVLYGGVGSACTYPTDCILAHSICRHGMCQCDQGLSFDSLRNKCERSCTAYGSTYQFTKNKFIEDFNSLSLDDLSVSECQSECQRDDLGFECRTIDYFAGTRQCFLSNFTSLEVPGSSWKYNGIGVHLQRDCSGIE